MRFVVRVVCTVMGVVSAGALIRRSGAFIFMRRVVYMLMQIVGGKRRDVARCRQGSKAMGIHSPG